MKTTKQMVLACGVLLGLAGVAFAEEGDEQSNPQRDFLAECVFAWDASDASENCAGSIGREGTPEAPGDCEISQSCVAMVGVVETTVNDDGIETTTTTIEAFTEYFSVVHTVADTDDLTLCLNPNTAFGGYDLELRTSSCKSGEFDVATTQLVPHVEGRVDPSLLNTVAD